MMPFDLLWCEECGKVNVSTCEVHGKLGVMRDKEIPPMSKLTVPHAFMLRSTKLRSQGKNTYSVYARKLVQKRVQLGPLVAPVTSLRPTNSTHPHRMELMLFQRDGSYVWFDLSDETKCSWMMYACMDNDSGSHNAVVYQHGNHIYITTTKTISPNEELRVCYGSHYLMQMTTSLDTHTIDTYLSEDDTQDIMASDTEIISPVEMLHSDEVISTKEANFSEKSSDETHHTSDARQVVPSKLQSEGECILENVADEAIVTTSLSTHPSDNGVIKYNDDALIKEILEMSCHLSKAENNSGNAKKKKAVSNKAKVISKKEKKSFVCQQCEAVLPNRRSYNAHMLAHVNNKPYACSSELCGKRFASKYKLERHAVIHIAKGFTCSLCGRQFNRKDHLTSHMVVHNRDRKPHRCDVCGKEYNSLLMYKAHMALHAAERGATTCQICNSNFESKSELVFHIRVHSGSRLTKTAAERIHLCPFCPKSFYTQKDVRRHLVVHTKERDNLCQFCPLRFGRKDHLLRHIRMTHSDRVSRVDKDNTSPAAIKSPAPTKNARETKTLRKGGTPKRPVTHKTKTNSISIASTTVTVNKTSTFQTVNSRIRNADLNSIYTHITPVSSTQLSTNPRTTQSACVKTNPSVVVAVSPYVASTRQAATNDANPSTFVHTSATSYTQHQHSPIHSLATFGPANNLTVLDVLCQRNMTGVINNQKDTCSVLTRDVPHDSSQLPITTSQLAMLKYSTHDSNQRNLIDKQAPAFESVLGYLETLKFLDNLPTNSTMMGQCDSLAAVDEAVGTVDISHA